MTVFYGKLVPLGNEPEWRIDLVHRVAGDIVFCGSSASTWIVPGTLNEAHQ